MRIALLALLLLTGCAPETRTRTVDRPDTAPMELPRWGWTVSYTRHVEANGDVIDEGPLEFDCYIRRHTSGRSADVCGFTVEIGADAFSYDGEPYRAVSWFYGLLEITVSGAGDLEGSEIRVKAVQVETGATVYTMDYDVANVSEIPDAQAEAVAL